MGSGDMFRAEEGAGVWWEILDLPWSSSVGVGVLLGRLKQLAKYEVESKTGGKGAII